MHHFLEQASWIVQMLLVIIGIIGGCLAYRQLQSYNLFEMLKYIEAPETRAARNKVHRAHSKSGEDYCWWRNEELRKAASDVCASYDVLGRMSQRNSMIGDFFVEEWADSIKWSHQALEGFLKEQRINNPAAYKGYDWLYLQSCQRKKLFFRLSSPGVRAATS